MGHIAVDERDRFAGCLLGLAVGDAVGVTAEFRQRGSFAPVTDMTGGGPFKLPAGAWTDDTSMALCLGTSLLECRGFEARDQMQRYLRWRDDGYLSSTGKCFDIGNTVREALTNFLETGKPYSGSVSELSAGNGSIMRLAPVPMYFYPHFKATINYSNMSSWTTHGTTRCVEACQVLGAVLYRALAGMQKDEVLGDVVGETAVVVTDPELLTIAHGDYRTLTRDQVQGSGYVVRSLEAALWCFAVTESYEEAVLMAANLGDDADTTAAICGQVAGAYYGVSGMPDRWVQKVVMRDEILEMAEGLRMAVPEELLGDEVKRLAAFGPRVAGMTGENVVKGWAGGGETVDDDSGEVVRSVGYPEYEAVVEELRGEMWGEFWEDPAYMAEGMERFWDEPGRIEGASFGEVRKIVCGMVRRERFVWGDVWGGYFESGVLGGVLGWVGRVVGSGF